LQDEITMQIIRAVGLKLVVGEQYGESLIPPSGSLEVLMKVMKAYEYAYRMNREDNILARQEFEEAIALDPEYSFLYSGLAMTHLMDLYLQSSDSPLISLAQASKNIKKALELDDEDYAAYLSLAQLYWLRKERDKAIAAIERAITINPNGADAYAALGEFLAFTGKPEEGIKLIKKAIRLNPNPPAFYLMYLGEACYFLGRYEDSIEMLKKVLQRFPNNLVAHIDVAAAYSASGREEEARQEANVLLELDPEFSLDKVAEMFFIKEAESERFIADLRRAGLK
jgi:adenylate cyclase